MSYSLHPEAVKEFDGVADYYKKIQPTLSKKFEDEFDSTLERVLSFPEAWPLIKRNFKRCLLKRFPYGIIYKIDRKKDICLICVVMHKHRNLNTGRTGNFRFVKEGTVLLKFWCIHLFVDG